MLVLCGAGDGKVFRALDSVGLLDLPDVEFFVTFNDAMECELVCLYHLPVCCARTSRRDGKRVSACLVRVKLCGNKACW